MSGSTCTLSQYPSMMRICVSHGVAAFGGITCSMRAWPKAAESVTK